MAIEADAAVVFMRENTEAAIRLAWQTTGTTPPTMVTLWNPEKIAVVPILEAGHPEQATRAAVRELDAHVYVLCFAEGVQQPDGSRVWCAFIVWGTREGGRGGTLFPLKNDVLHGRHFGEGRDWASGADELWRVVFDTPPEVAVVH